MEAPPNIWEFGRYDKSSQSVYTQTALHATRVQLGELVDTERRPPMRFTVPDNYMALYKSDGMVCISWLSRCGQKTFDEH